MSADTKPFDGLAKLELAREVENDLSHHEFRVLHAYCAGQIQEFSAAPGTGPGTQLYCAVCDISSAAE